MLLKISLITPYNVKSNEAFALLVAASHQYKLIHYTKRTQVKINTLQQKNSSKIMGHIGCDHITLGLFEMFHG